VVTCWLPAAIKISACSPYRTHIVVRVIHSYFCSNYSNGTGDWSLLKKQPHWLNIGDALHLKAVPSSVAIELASALALLTKMHEQTNSWFIHNCEQIRLHPHHTYTWQRHPNCEQKQVRKCRQAVQLLLRSLCYCSYYSY
jgi:hypothetical protein